MVDLRTRGNYLVYMDSVTATLLEGGFPVSLTSFSAVDRYCGLKPAPFHWAETQADLTDLTRLFGELRFPGLDLADAAIECEDTHNGRSVWYFRCLEQGIPPAHPSFSVLAFAWNPARKAFFDSDDRYRLLRRLRDGKRTATEEGREPVMETSGERDAWFDAPEIKGGPTAWRAAADAAVIVSRYRGAAPENQEALVLDALVARMALLPAGPLLGPEEQRVALSMLMTSRRPELGLELLLRTGFIHAHWPELAAMNEVDHSKEFHPEGNAWAHTLETFRYRKILDLNLSLGLLLHDTGKAQAESSGGRRFDGHAELGAWTARRFLNNLGYDSATIADVDFLVRNHMLPAALPRLPLTRTQTALESPLFPLLLELYRCDESSSFKGQNGFYDSCAAYRAYLRNVKNPYRSGDGKKLMRRLFESR